jgi:hypothetical protein
LDELNRKTLTLDLKADSEGEFSAVFATFDVVDHDGDVTRRGAFTEGAEVIIGAFGHDTTSLPVGKGVIRQTNEAALVYGKFFLDTPHGQQTYQTVKNLGALQEWSYTYSPTKRSFGEFNGQQVRFLEEVKVYSVDPVLAGAGIGTRTTGIKSRLSFVDHCEEVESLLAEFTSRVKERAALREKEGRMLSAANVGKLSSIAESLKAAAADLEKLLADAEPKSTRELEQAFLRFQQIRATLLGVA